MTPNIKIELRTPQSMPGFLEECLNRLHLNEGVMEFIGPRFKSEEIAVYGYYVPAMHHILCPCNSVLCEGIEDFTDLDYVEKEVNYYSAVEELMCNLVGLIQEYPSQKILYQDDTSEDFCNLIFQKAISENQYCLDLYLISKRSMLLTWDEIWQIFDIERYNMVIDANVLIETKNFIIYLHLPEYDSKDSAKSIFRFYCNNPKMPQVPFIILSECKENQIAPNSNSSSNREYEGYEYLSTGYDGYQDILYRLNKGKPIVKFDGFTSDSNRCVKFGYQYDGIYYVYAIDHNYNILLKN